MTARRPAHRRAGVLAAALLVVAGLAGGCSGSDTAVDGAAVDDAAVDDAAVDRPAVVPGGGSRLAGPVRRAAADDLGSFSTVCEHTHRAADDPIVHRGRPGESHLHEFFGNPSTDSTSTADTLLAAAGECDAVADRSAYWVPTLYADGRPVTPVGLAAYYRTAPGADPAWVHAPPNGLELVSVGAGWQCARTDAPTATPGTCGESTPLRLHLTFPDCWDGARLSSADLGHLVASADGECPGTHPVQITRIELEVRYGISGAPGALSLSSGDLAGAHGDVIVAWDRGFLEGEVASCVRRLVVCDLSWNTGLGAGY
jgi:hypothetical protein